MNPWHTKGLGHCGMNVNVQVTIRGITIGQHIKCLGDNQSSYPSSQRQASPSTEPIPGPSQVVVLCDTAAQLS
jgi:hypothetical protein